jgi:hypothetical protein
MVSFPDEGLGLGLLRAPRPFWRQAPQLCGHALRLPRAWQCNTYSSQLAKEYANRASPPMGAATLVISTVVSLFLWVRES